MKNAIHIIPMCLKFIPQSFIVKRTLLIDLSKPELNVIKSIVGCLRFVQDILKKYDSLFMLMQFLQSLYKLFFVFDSLLNARSN